MNEMMKLALLGTAKSPVQTLPASELSEVLPSLAASETLETQLLLAVGCEAVYQSAGQVCEIVDPIDPAPTSATRITSPVVVDGFQSLLSEENLQLLRVVLSELSDRELSVPDQILPDLLSITDPELRQQLLPVLGARGRWLSQFQPEWEWANSFPAADQFSLEELEQHWTEETVQRRVEILSDIRKQDSERARTLLEEAFPKEKADDRNRFLTTFEINLSAADEELLSKCLRDRSKLVRKTAADLLSLLAGSEVAQRLQQRIDLVIVSQKRATGPLRLKCLPPETLPDDWIADGILEKPPQGRGQKSYWVEQIVAAVPVTAATAQFSSSPTELINAILNDDFAHSVITGWTISVSRHESSEVQQLWFEPLWKYWSAMAQHPHTGVREQALVQLGSLTQLVSSERTERAILHLLQSVPDPAALPVCEILNWSRSIWSVPFGKEYLRMTRSLFGKRSDRSVYDWGNSLAIAAARLPASLLEPAMSPWQIRDHGVQAWQVSAVERVLQDFLSKIRLRHDLDREFERLQAGQPSH